jgi:single-stranded-DNA-specific exonuclease
MSTTAEQRFVSLSNPRRVWAEQPVDGAAVAALSVEADLSRTLARMLIERGITDPLAAAAFLEPDLEREWRSPELLHGMPEAADAVAAAVRAGKRIVVFGDFDVDGVTAAALTATGLKALGGTGTVIVPDRFKDGYGLTASSVARIRKTAPDLVITVDCGISGGVEVAELVAAGIDVVVTDHHEPGDAVPQGVPVADPKLGGEHAPFTELAGVGVALKLIAAVGARLGRPDVWRELTDLAAIGTVADIVPLLGENRALVAAGLRRMRIGARPGITALAEVAGIQLPAMSADRIAFGIAPRMNAAGRMADPRIALELLLTSEPVRASTLAAELERLNRERQAVEADLFSEAEPSAEAAVAAGERALVLAGDGWHEGVKGIVASRFVGRYGLPTLLFCVDEGEARGSGRSVADVDLYEAVATCGDLLERFGGHRQAVGLTVAAETLPAFRERFLAEMAALPAESFTAVRTVDAVLALEDVSLELVRELAMLEPAGLGNPKPVFLAPRVTLRDAACVGRDMTHLRFTADDGTARIGAMAFRCEDIDERLAQSDEVGIVFEVEPDDYRGRNGVRLVVRDFVTAG